MKCFLITFFCILLTLPANAYTIKGNITYTVEAAREKAFENVAPQIDISKYKEYFIDKNYAENMKAIAKNKFNIKNRKLTLFSDNKYAILYKNLSNIVFYYDKTGKLEFIDIQINEHYPKKYVTYDINGNLDSIVFTIRPHNSYIFDLNKKLHAYWIDNKCFDENNKFIDTRKY